MYLKERHVLTIGERVQFLDENLELDGEVVVLEREVQVAIISRAEDHLYYVVLFPDDRFALIPVRDVA